MKREKYGWWLLRVGAFLPIAAAYLVVQLTEPFPHRWLSPTNPHYWPNVLRAATFSFCGVLLGMIAYVLLRTIEAERQVSSGHPRRRLFGHVSVLAFSQGILIATLLFYVRERINDPLSPATPLAFVALIGTFGGLGLMIRYQNSRLAAFLAARQVIAVVRPGEESGDLRLRVVGATEPISVEKWTQQFEGGVLSRVTVEPVAADEKPRRVRRYLRWISYRGEGEFHA